MVLTKHSTHKEFGKGREYMKQNLPALFSDMEVGNSHDGEQ